MQQNIFTILIASMLLIAGCDNTQVDKETRDQLVRQNAEKYFLQRAPAGHGYEFVSLEETGKVTYKDNVAFRKDFIQKEIDHNQRMLELAKQKQDSFPTVNFSEKIAEYQGKVDKYQQVLDGIKQLEKELDGKLNDVASYVYEFKLKADIDSTGRKEHTYYIQTDPGYGILKLTNIKEELYPNPNDFPGYREMAGAILVQGE